MSTPLTSLKKTRKTPLLYTDSLSLSNDLLTKSNNTAYTEQFADSKSVSPSLPSFNPNNGFLHRSINKPTSTSKSTIASRTHISPRDEQILSTSRSVPYKHSAADAELLDEITTKVAHNNMRKMNHLPKLTYESINKEDNTGSPSNIDLLQMMMKKLKYQEARCNTYEKELKEKDKRIKILEEKVKLFEKANEKISDKYVAELENKCYLLEEQVYDMEIFLADYGLKWIGDRETKIYSTTEDRSTLDFEKNLNEETFKCNYDVISNNIKELNSLIYNNEPVIVENSNRATFKAAKIDRVKLTLFKNGISLFNGPFRPFTDIKTQQFCNDISDGFYPSELQKRFPEGVIFDVIDKRDLYFKDERNSVFESEGYRLGTKDEDFQNKFETQLTESKITVDKFLQTLPSCVIRHGNVVSVRDEISDKLKGIDSNNKEIYKEPKVVIVPTTITSVENIVNSLDTIHENSVTQFKTSDRIATLKVKLENGQTYILRMKYSDTINSVKKYLRSETKNITNEFDLVSMYPHKIFKEENLTLEQCHLVPNSTILMVMRR